MNRYFLIALFYLGYYWPLPVVAAQPPTEQYALSITEAVRHSDQQKIVTVCRDWRQSGTYSTTVLNWNYNTLLSLEQDAILVVQSDSEVYPLWMLQLAQGVQENVTVISYESLENPGYRSFISGWKKIEFAGASSQEILHNLLTANSTGPVYIGVMMDKSVIEREKNHLYLTGLTLKFSETPFDNIAILKQHYESDFLLDYLRQDFSKEPEPEKIAAMNLNYLPAFLLLYGYYTDHNNETAAENLRDLSLRIARAGNREQELTTFLAIQPSVKPGDIAVKPIEKSMKKVDNKLWASEVETTNEQYEIFLTHLLKNKDYEQLNLCKSLKTNWKDLLPDSLRHLSDAALYKNGHPDDPKMPVQQITHEAAERYCAWLTSSYNASSEKKKFKKVVFRLPTEQEWMDAARANRDKNTPYPWGGYFYRNSKGCYLMNLNATEPCPDCDTKRIANDGGYFTVSAAAYFPNDFGLYNMSGNVAEMIREPGKSKGGSWQDDGYHAQISPVQTYTGPGPALGFRVFMEVIEE